MIDIERGAHLKKLPNGVLYIWFYVVGQCSSISISKDSPRVGHLRVSVTEGDNVSVASINVSDLFLTSNYTMSYFCDKDEITIVCIPKQLIKESKYSSIPVSVTENKLITSKNQNKNAKKNFIQ